MRKKKNLYNMYVSGNISNTENIPCVIMTKDLNKQQSGKCKRFDFKHWGQADPSQADLHLSHEQQLGGQEEQWEPNIYSEETFKKYICFLLWENYCKWCLLMHTVISAHQSLKIACTCKCWNCQASLPYMAINTTVKTDYLHDL